MTHATTTIDTEPMHAESIDGTGAQTDNAGGYYATRTAQLDPWHARLRHRRLTYRKIGLYALAASMLLLASPTLSTYIVGALLMAAGLILRLWTFGHLEKNVHMIT